MFDELKNAYPGFWEKYKHMFKELRVPENTIILHEGDISKNVYFIRKGCLRMWFNKDGKDVTFQFFFENQAVASIESFWNKTPSMVNLEAIESSVLFGINKKNFETLLNEVPGMKDGFLEIALRRMKNYSLLFLSRIKDSPRERYLDLLANNPHIMERVPQHYIASYLGITPVSLSRIKNKKN